MSDNDIEVRKATRDDCERIAELHHAAEFCFDDAAILTHYFDDSFDPVAVLIAETAGAVVGIVELEISHVKSEGPFGVIKRLVVEPSHRKRGIATCLLEAAFREAEQRGCTYVEGNVAAANFELLDFYWKMGLRPQRMELIVAKRLQGAGS